jgi:hypothetical protein
MKTNVGSADRVVRVVVGGALVAAAVTGAVGPWGYIGVVPLLTAAMGTCPLYTVFGFSTCPIRKAATEVSGT